MGPSRRSWFLAPRAPNFDCSPHGYLALGSIIKDPLEPERPLAPGAQGLPIPLPDHLHVEKAQKSDWRDVVESRKNGKIGVWAQFLQFVGLEDLSAGWNDTKLDSYKFTSLDIEWFNPPADFLKERMQAEQVTQYIARGIFPPSVYMITAVMIARGAAIGKERARSWEAHARFGVDLTAAGAPGVTVGPDVGASTGRRRETTAASSSDFVFAYRLSKVQYGRKDADSGERMLAERQYTRGAAFSDRTEGEEGEGAEVLQVLDLDSLELENITSEDFSLQSEVVTDELDNEDDSECVFPE
jgi:hypothetical protein